MTLSTAKWCWWQTNVDFELSHVNLLMIQDSEACNHSDNLTFKNIF
jgi:hypothetical protein